MKCIRCMKMYTFHVFFSSALMCLQTFHLPRTFIPLLKCSDFLTVKCGCALVLLVGTGTLVDTVWIWRRRKENNNELENLTYDSDITVHGG